MERAQEQTKFWLARDLGNFEVLRARNLLLAMLVGIGVVLIARMSGLK